MRKQLTIATILCLPLLLAGCGGKKLQPLTVKAGEAEVVSLSVTERTEDYSFMGLLLHGGDRVEVKDRKILSVVTDGEGSLRAKYKIVRRFKKKKKEDIVVGEGLTPDTVSLERGGNYTVEVVHPVSNEIHSTQVVSIFKEERRKRRGGAEVSVANILIPGLAHHMASHKVLSDSEVYAGFDSDGKPQYGTRNVPQLFGDYSYRKGEQKQLVDLIGKGKIKVYLLP